MTITKQQQQHESRFLEAPLVRREAETDGELKNGIIIIEQNLRIPCIVQLKGQHTRRIWYPLYIFRKRGKTLQNEKGNFYCARGAES